MKNKRLHKILTLSPHASNGSCRGVADDNVLGKDPTGLVPVVNQIIFQAMDLQPIYTPENVRPVHNLRFDWTGWLSDNPSRQDDVLSAAESCRHALLSDGIDLDTATVNGSKVQVLAGTQPTVSPVHFAQRVKGRLQHALRQTGLPSSFRRRISVRVLGDNTRQTVENYIDCQAIRSDYDDPRFRDFLGQFAVSDPSVHLAAASSSTHGRYWYNLHLVIVVQDRRYPVTRTENFRKLRNGCIAIAKKKGYEISHLAVMPDHIHAAVRGAIEHSPEEIALAFMNNLSYLMGYNRCWSWEYYVGSFSEYGVGAIKGK